MLLSKKEIKEQCIVWKNTSKSIVFTNGCFDLLHRGHIDLLEKAATFGDILIVGLNSDKSVKIIKGTDRPIESENVRIKHLIELGMVLAICLFDNDTPLELIQIIKPDVLVKGGDYQPKDIVGIKEIVKGGGRVEIIPLTPGYSTTISIEKMKREGLV